jgi:hypothetical protein
MSDVPLTLDELKTELGKDMLLFALDIFGQDNASSQRMVIVAPPAHHIEAANKMREDNPEDMKAIGMVAERALQELPGGIDNALTSIMSDLSKDLYGARSILSRKARYLATVFGALMKQTPEDIEKCLKAIVAFGNGE